VTEDFLPRADPGPVGPSRQWPRWAAPAAAAVSAVLGVAVGIGALAGQRHLAGLPGVAAPGAVVLLAGAVMALAAGRPVVFVLLLAFGVVTWHGGDGDLGLIGFAMPISFAGYGLAVAIAAVSYQSRTRPEQTAVAPCPGPPAAGAG
jgi:hypothetical protein